MNRGSVRVFIDIEIPPEVAELVKRNQEIIAGMIAAEAHASAAFSDKSGVLRAGIKAEKRGDRWIARAKAPHAHLVEYGHGGPNPAPAHPFLRPAKFRVLSHVK
jgi:hypothetical protein